MIGQKLTRSQRELMEAARQPVGRHCEVEIVRVTGSQGGVSYAARQAERISRVDRTGPRCAALCTTSIYEAVGELIEETGDGRGHCGNLRTFTRCLRILSGDTHRAVCLLFDKAGLLSPNEQDTLKALCDAAAYRAGCRVRLVLLLQQVLLWQPDINKSKKVRGRRISDHLAAHARVWDYSADGMDEILGVPANETEQESDRRVAIA